MKWYLVTGGCGFIGSNIVDKLVEYGHKVIVIDNLFLGKKDYIQKYIEQGKVIHLYSVDELLNNVHLCKRINGIFHLGQASSTTMYRDNKMHISKAIRDMILLLELCKWRNIPLVFASSSSLYWGNPLPYKENMNILPFDFYTETKYYCERLMRVYSNYYNLKTIALRLFSVYGQHEEHKGKYANIITQMIWHGLQGKTFIIYDDGNQTRDFIHVNDVVDAFITSMIYLEGIKHHDSPYFNIFNVCKGTSFSFNEILTLIYKTTGLKVNVTYHKCPLKFYVRHTKGDNSKIKKKLGWKPSISIVDGIKMTYEYYKKLFS